MKKLVIFDMDGLMFDSERLAGECLLKAGKHFGYDITWESRLELLGKNKETNLKYMKKVYGEDFPVEEIFALSTELRMKHIEENGLPMKKGLIELLDYLKEKKVLTMIASSSSVDTIKKYLSITHISEYFNAIISGDEVTRCKPDPEIFLKACKYFDVDTSDAIVLEDSTSGILAAFHGDIDVICVPDLVIPEEKYMGCTLATVENLVDVKEYFMQNDIV